MYIPCWNGLRADQRRTRKRISDCPEHTTWPLSLMVLHIHKCGGTTVGTTFQKRSKLTWSSSRTSSFDKVTYLYAQEMKQASKNATAAATLVESHRRALQRVVNGQQTHSPLHSCKTQWIGFYHQHVNFYLVPAKNASI